MFHFPSFATLLRVLPEHDFWWVSPFGHPWVKARLAARHGFSQPSTSFFASRYQGIHRMPLLT